MKNTLRKKGGKKVKRSERTLNSRHSLLRRRKTKNPKNTTKNHSHQQKHPPQTRGSEIVRISTTKDAVSIFFGLGMPGKRRKREDVKRNSNVREILLRAKQHYSSVQGGAGEQEATPLNKRGRRDQREWGMPTKSLPRLRSSA